MDALAVAVEIAKCHQRVHGATWCKGLTEFIESWLTKVGCTIIVSRSGPELGKQSRYEEEQKTHEKKKKSGKKEKIESFY